MRVCLAFLLIVVPAIARSQVPLPPPQVSVKHYTDCFNWAINNDGMIQGRDSIWYTCRGNVAKAWFDSIGANAGEYHGQGLWLRKQTVVGYCGHRVEDAAGNSVSQFLYSIEQAKP
jgi:hypothetical protein